MTSREQVRKEYQHIDDAETLDHATQPELLKPNWTLIRRNGCSPLSNRAGGLQWGAGHGHKELSSRSSG